MTPFKSPDPLKAPAGAKRFWLYAPFVVLAIAVVAWTAGWFWMRGEVFRRMDLGARVLGESGYRIDWGARSLSGFPFRLDLDIAAPRFREISGWGLSAPRLKAEAFVFAPDHWVIVAPAGVTLNRRVGGPVTIGAKVLRGSLTEMGAHPPRLSIEGMGLTFAAAPGASPVMIASAEGLHLHAKAGPMDQGAFYVEVDKAGSAGPSLLNDIAADAPVTLIVDAIFSHAGAPGGQGFAGALRGWGEAGGGLNIRRLSLQAGPVTAETGPGALAIGGDGRLKGVLDLRMKQGRRLLAAWGARSGLAPEAATSAQAILDAHDRGGVTAVSVNFQAGQTTIGPVAVAPAPRVY